ncbi:MAG: hypothetical protein ACR2LJ_00185 [Acidimicrobiales bacterium]
MAVVSCGGSASITGVGSSVLARRRLHADNQSRPWPQTDAGPSLLTGRLATVVAYLPMMGLLPLDDTGEAVRTAPPACPPCRPSCAAGPSSCQPSTGTYSP